MRTRPSSRAPLVAVTSACVPAESLPSSDAVTSARHSSRPLRIRRNSSAPLLTTAPTVAVRAEITPSSGARTEVCDSRTSCACSCARAAATRARAVASAVMYWLICEALMAPVCDSVRARAALLAASAAAASARPAPPGPAPSRRAGSRCEPRQHLPAAHAVADAHQHFRDAQPAGLRADARLLPGPRLPLAASVVGSSVDCGVTVVTVRAGRAGAFFASSFLSQPPAAAPATARGPRSCLGQGSGSPCLFPQG